MHVPYKRLLTNAFSFVIYPIFVCSHASFFFPSSAKPSFTIRLQDQFIAKGADLMWECEAFGIPDVDYEWLRNSEPLRADMFTEDEKNRYELVVSRRSGRIGRCGIYLRKICNL